MMRWVKRFLLLLVLLFAGLWFCRGQLFRAVVDYHIIGSRHGARPLFSTGGPVSDVEAAINLALDTTAARLHFSTGSVKNDPGELVQGSPANCIGYAALCAALIKGHLQQVGNGERFAVEPVVGKLYIGGLDLHTCFNSPFWKDHDIVRVKDKASGTVILLDPTLYDALGIARVRGVE